MSPEELLNRIHIHEDLMLFNPLTGEYDNEDSLNDINKDLYNTLCACEDYVKLAVSKFPLDAVIVNGYLHGVCPYCLQPYTQHLNELSYFVDWHCPVCGQAIDKNIVDVIGIKEAFKEE